MVTWKVAPRVVLGSVHTRPHVFPPLSLQWPVRIRISPWNSRFSENARNFSRGFLMSGVVDMEIVKNMDADFGGKR